jgi:hypothetical protein
MVMEFKKFMNKTFGTPQEALRTVTGISEAVTSLDNSKLRLLKSILEAAAKVKGSPEELQTVLELVRLIVAADIGQLTAVRDITANLVKLVRLLPKEGLASLPLKEIVAEVRKSG